MYKRQQYDELLQKLSQRYEAEGEKVYCIPMGGSNLVGMCGYRECAQEIDAQAKQLGMEKARLVCAVGSIGTYMGLYLSLIHIYPAQRDGLLWREAYAAVAVPVVMIFSLFREEFQRAEKLLRFRMRQSMADSRIGKLRIE